jgi:hypothetical protein
VLYAAILLLRTAFKGQSDIVRGTT